LTESTGRRERKRLQTIDKLAETAWGLFEAQGFEQVTMEAIADAADVAKGTLYKHFPVKEALLQHQIHAQMQAELPKLLAQLKSTPDIRGRLRGFFAISADWSERHRDYLPHYLHFRMNPAGRGSRSGTDRIFAWLIEAGIQRGELRRDLSPETGVHYLTFLYLGALLRWLSTPDLILNEELDNVVMLFLDGMGRKS
jgi:AcrR family transcriptional regulator